MFDVLVGESAQGLRICLSILPCMLVGCLVASLFRHWRFGCRFFSCFAPAFSFAGLRGKVAAYPLLAFLDIHSANVFLASIVNRDDVERKPIVGFYLIGVFPSSLYFHVFYSAPILYAGIGYDAASVVIMLYLFASLLTSLVGVCLLRARVTQANERPERPLEDDRACRWPGWSAALRDGAANFFKIAMVFIPLILTLELFLAIPAVKSTLDRADSLFLWAGMPADGVLVVITALPNILVGFATAITCLDDGLITLSEIPRILLIAAMGNIVFSSISFNVTSNIAIFGAKMGVRLTLVGLFVRLSCLFLALYVA